MDDQHCFRSIIWLLVFGHLAETEPVVFRNFQRRWFVLRGNLLFYFEKKSERSEPSGMVVLEGCTVELAEEEQEKPFAFKIAFHGEGKRTYIAATESQVRINDCLPAPSDPAVHVDLT